MGFGHQAQQMEHYAHRPKLTQCVVVILGKRGAGKTTFIGAVSSYVNGPAVARSPEIKESKFNFDGTEITFLEVPPFQEPNFEASGAWSNAQIFGWFSKVLWTRFQKKRCHQVAAVLYIYNSRDAPDPVDLFYWGIMTGMAGTQNYNRLDLIFNDHGLAPSNSEEREFLTWTDPLVPDPIPYNSPSVPPQIIENILGVREAVTLELVNELHRNKGKRHKTTVGEKITRQIAEEDNEIVGKIREKGRQKESLSRTVKDRPERKRQENALEDEIKALKEQHGILKKT